MKRADGLRERVDATQLELPRVNALVRVAVGVGPDPDGPLLAEEVASRIEDLADVDEPGTATPRLMLAAPRYPGDTELPRPGTACWVAWPTDRGLMQLPVGFVAAAYANEQLAAWWVEVTGPAVRTERRRYFRVTLHLPLRLHVSDVELTAHAVDLSEGGLRCLIPRAVADSAVQLGTTVQVAFTPEGYEELNLTATVVRHLPGLRREDPHELGLRFLDPRTYDDIMRKVIYSEQLRARRNRLL